MINGPCKAFIPLAFFLITAGCALKFDTQPVKPPVDGTVEPDLDATDLDHDQDDAEEDPIPDLLDDDAGEEDMTDADDPVGEDPAEEDAAEEDPVEEDPGEEEPTNPYFPLDYYTRDLCTDVEAIDISSLGLTAPDAGRRSRWGTFLGYVLSGDWGTAYGYNRTTMLLQVYVVRDTGTSPARDYVVVHDDTNGEGIYVFAVAPDNPLVVEVPYSLEHTGTLEQGCALLRGNTTDGGGWALLVGGTARCESTVTLPCDGTTVECTGGTPEDFRRSDVAHNPNLIFHVVHRDLMTRDGAAIAAQIQGQSDASGANAIISDGTTFDGTFPVGISVAVRNSLRISISPWASAIHSCNDPADASSYTSDCQITNVQGRETNGSGNLCSLDATSSADRFLVLEQSLAMRGSTYHDELTSAVLGLFP
ncbi:MAG: hypothetical protein JRG91_19905 [Deltaproteobacteria bacterium]|nr:hypothetical protein [Deltaproteobacteria bacterium]